MKKTTLSTLIAVALGTVVASNANAFTLTSGNASVDGGLLGLSSWTQGGVNHLAGQNWWFNASTGTGSTPFNYELADYDNDPTETTQGANNATVAYDLVELGLNVDIDYTLGGGPGTTSSLSENIQITNNSGGVALFTLYQYTDFDLGGYSPYDSNADNVGNGTDSLNYGQNDTVEQVTANFVRQTNGAMTITEQSAAVPSPGLTSIGQALALEDALFYGTVTGTNDGDTYTGDAAWIWAFTFEIAAGDTASISKSLVLDAVPVPAAVWLFGSGLLGLVGIARRRA